MSIRIALAGNPNCGKTTLFNLLTGLDCHVGNWPGVTVEKHAEKFKLNGQIQASLKVVCVDNIDYQIGLFVYEKTERRALFVRERT